MQKEALNLDLNNSKSKNLIKLIDNVETDQVESSIRRLVDKLTKKSITRILPETQPKCPFGFKRKVTKIRLEFYGGGYHYLTYDVDSSYTAQQLTTELQTKIRVSLNLNSSGRSVPRLGNAVVFSNFLKRI